MPSFIGSKRQTRLSQQPFKSHNHFCNCWTWSKYTSECSLHAFKNMQDQLFIQNRRRKVVNWGAWHSNLTKIPLIL